MTEEHNGRTGFGNRLRRLRQDAELSGKELAGQLGWPASKVSRLENGRQTASTDDVHAWTKALDVSEDVRDELVKDLRSLRVEYATWRRQLSSGFAPRQRAGVVLANATAEFRGLTTSIVPGLLQTADYARHVFLGLAPLHADTTDVEEAVRTRMRRQEVLYQPERHFRIVVTESSLRARPCPLPILRAQLDRLLALSGLQNLQLAVLPSDARLPTSAKHSFWMYDQNLVLVETFSAELAIRDREDIELYERLFEAFWSAALHDQQAFDFIAALALELGRSAAE
ncbi:helix-turn-helix domain-containing protein [Pseudonocardia spinosispora]|uniref:helix-turn-helix domain-containing protein n=1 Tax=Pseudonocardia spinosispora TaxID=103441 RepID=UPI000427AD8B|nr:helix-turn-helix transcriptional regulator [Pseudonocardia spinosispora]